MGKYRFPPDRWYRFWIYPVRRWLLVPGLFEKDAKILQMRKRSWPQCFDVVMSRRDFTRRKIVIHPDFWIWMATSWGKLRLMILEDPSMEIVEGLAYLLLQLQTGAYRTLRIAKEGSLPRACTFPKSTSLGSMKISFIPYLIWKLLQLFAWKNQGEKVKKVEKTTQQREKKYPHQECSGNPGNQCFRWLLFNL